MNNEWQPHNPHREWIHTKTGNRYVVWSDQIEVKIETGHWVQGVMYLPCNTMDVAMRSRGYVRTLASFRESFHPADSEQA